MQRFDREPYPGAEQCSPTGSGSVRTRFRRILPASGADMPASLRGKKSKKTKVFVGVRVSV